MLVPKVVIHISEMHIHGSLKYLIYNKMYQFLINVVLIYFYLYLGTKYNSMYALLKIVIHYYVVSHSNNDEY